MKYFQLTAQQQNIWNLQKYYGKTAIGNQCGAIFFKEKRNNSFLKQAIRLFIKNQKGIRLRFVEKEKPMQYISDEINGEISVMKFSSMEEFTFFAERYAKEPIALTDKSMYRFIVFELEEKSGILVTLSHLISDAWTFGLMGNQIDAAYLGLAGRGDGVLFEADYTEYIQSENNYLISENYKKDKCYWEEQYSSGLEKSMIKICPSGQDSIEAKRFTKDLSQDLNNQIEKYCKGYSVTPAVLFETAIISYLSRINPENTSITIGVLILNRRNFKEKKIAGMFVSTMPLTVTVSGDMKVSELMKRITKKHMDLFRHQRYPYSDILKLYRENQKLSGNLYDVMISFQNAKTDTGADTKWYSNGYSEVPFAIHIDNRNGHKSPTVNVDYQTAVFKDEREVEYIVERIEYILQQIIWECSKAIKDIKIIPEKELKKIVCEFNDTYIEYSKEKCIHELFTDQVKRTPDRNALIFEKKKFTYKELDEMSNSVAHFLREKGVRPNDVVPIIAKRSWHVIVAMLGIMKAGGAFMSIDATHPIDRIKYMIEDAQAKISLVFNYDNSNCLGITIINLVNFDFKYNCTKINNVNSCNDLCYVVYTSGINCTPCQGHFEFV